MPTLTNNTEAAIPLPLWGGQSVDAGQAIQVAKYPESIPAGLDLTNHLPSPFVAEHAGALPVALTALSKYKTISIANDSGAVIECSFNEEETPSLYLLHGQVQPISLNGDVWSLAITGDGEGSVYVVCAKKARQNEGATKWQI